jgi:hypothetical protein
MHDPLCFEFDNKDDCGFDHSLQSPFCYCELIAKVREDERKEATALVNAIINAFKWRSHLKSEGQ